MTDDIPKLRVQFRQEEFPDIVAAILVSMTEPRRKEPLRAAGKVDGNEIAVDLNYSIASPLWEVTAIVTPLGGGGPWGGMKVKRFIRYPTARRYFDHLVAKYTLTVSRVTEVQVVPHGGTK